MGCCWSSYGQTYGQGAAYIALEVWVSLEGELAAKATECWDGFLEAHCIMAPGRYVPVKIIIQSFSAYLQSRPDFMHVFNARNTRNVRDSRKTCTYASVQHFAALEIGGLLTARNMALSSGFHTPNTIPDRRFIYDYKLFIDERCVIGMDLLHFVGKSC